MFPLCRTSQSNQEATTEILLNLHALNSHMMVIFLLKVGAKLMAFAKKLEIRPSERKAVPPSFIL
jgi:hypothetical protein